MTIIELHYLQKDGGRRPLLGIEHYHLQKHAGRRLLQGSLVELIDQHASKDDDVDDGYPIGIIVDSECGTYDSPKSIVNELNE